jgi:hypothetical protein
MGLDWEYPNAFYHLLIASHASQPSATPGFLLRMFDGFGFQQYLGGVLKCQNSKNVIFLLLKFIEAKNKINMK